MLQSNQLRSEEESDPTEISIGRRFFNVQTLISFVVAFAIIYFALTKIDIDIELTARRIASANIGLFVIAIITYYVSFLFRSIRWRVLLKNVGFDEKQGITLPSLWGLTRIIMLSWFANCIMPAKLGDAYRGYLLKRDSGVSFSKTIGTVVAERIVDITILFVLMVVAGLRVFHGTVPEAFAPILYGGLALLGVLAVVLLAMKHFRHVLTRVIPPRLKPMYLKFEEGTFLSFQNLPLVSGLTILVWLAEAGRLWFVSAAVGATGVGLGVVVFLALASSLLTTLPMTPAGLGIVESALITLLLLLDNIGAVQGVDRNAAASIAVLDRLISYWSLIAVGLVVYLLSRRGRGLRQS